MLFNSIAIAWLHVSLSFFTTANAHVVRAPVQRRGILSNSTSSIPYRASSTASHAAASSSVVTPSLVLGTTCFQLRDNQTDTVSAQDIETFVKNATLQACQTFNVGHPVTTGVPISGYEFYGASAINNDGNTCINAFTNITQQCISGGNFYGGQYIVAGQLYNLTNLNYPNSPLDPYNNATGYPAGPSIPPPAVGCVQNFNVSRNFTLSAATGQTSVSQEFDLTNFPQLFQNLTQWRFYTAEESDVQSYTIQFVGGASPQVNSYSNPSVSFFDWGVITDIPSKLTVTLNFISGLTSSNPNYQTILKVDGIASLDCDTQWTPLPAPVSNYRNLTADEIQTACSQALSQYSVTDGSLWNGSDATATAVALEFGFGGGINNISFDQYTSNSFHGPSTWDCNLGNSNCGSGLSCTDVDSVAGFAIMESQLGLHNYFQTLLNAMTTATADAALGQGTFAATFTVSVSTENMLKTLLDVATAILGVTNAGIGFFAGIGKLGPFDGKLIDKGTSGVVSIASGAISATKDNLPSSEQMWLNEGDISSGLQQFILGLSQSFGKYVGDLFTQGMYKSSSGDTYWLMDMLNGGLWLTNPFVYLVNGTLTEVNEVNVTSEFLKIFYCQMINVAWRVDDQRRPVIIPYDSADQQIDMGLGSTTVSDFFGSNVTVTWNNKAYVLYAYDMQQGAMPNAGGTSDTLTGDPTVYGGLTIEDIVISSVSGYIANGNKNGYNMTFPSYSFPNGSTSNLPFPAGVQTPGFSTIPVCSIDNWATQYGNSDGSNQANGVNDPKYPYFPCMS